ncbi:MAG: class I SAM-dependent methyltransferase [Proteobacteria bacterium]|nr:class I SAM-dependent methyltransferase [Pseudomonadota bacterium]
MTLWDNQAKRWANIGSPLRPSPIDIQTSSSWIKHLITTDEKPFTVLLLGVTPEIAHIRWPKNTRLIAIDNNFSMLKSILPSETQTIKPQGFVGDWLKLPLADAKVDLVIGDGCFTCITENNYEKMIKEIRRVISPAGAFIIRFFIRPNITESIGSVHQEFLSGKIENFHVLKWRIAMALHGSLNQGVSLNSIWESWNTLFKKNNQSLFKRLQWPQSVIQTIDNYKESSVYYTFPTLQEVRTRLNSYFKEQDIFFPNYALGERCPTFNFIPL